MSQLHDGAEKRFKTMRHAFQSLDVDRSNHLSSKEILEVRSACYSGIDGRACRAPW